MPVSPFFSNINSLKEQKLVDDLVNEATRQRGIDVYYLPRTIKNEDTIYLADTVSEYNDNFLTEMYIKDFNNYNPPNEFMSKFGIEFRDDLTLSCPLTAFAKNVIRYNPTYQRPQESDLIYIPFLSRIFVIKYVDYKPIFFALGTQYYYDLKLEVWEYSSEALNTGIPDIDNIQVKFTMDSQDWQLLTNDEFFIADNNGYALVQGQFDFSAQNAIQDNDEIEKEANVIVDFSESNPFSE